MHCLGGGVDELSKLGGLKKGEKIDFFFAFLLLQCYVYFMFTPEVLVLIITGCKCQTVVGVIISNIFFSSKSVTLNSLTHF